VLLNAADSIQQLAELRKEQDDLMMSQKELQKQEKNLIESNRELGKSEKEIAEATRSVREEQEVNAIKINQLSKEIQSQQKALVNNTNANKVAEGSLKQMRTQLGLMTKEYADLSKAERDSEIGDTLSKSIR
jgi:hypothetical protein